MAGPSVFQRSIAPLRRLLPARFRGDRAIVEVRDEGVGMTQEFLREKLFRPFRSTKPNGMGLGAYESLQYIRSIGGNLQVHSEPSVGTTMVVELRTAAADEAVEMESSH